ncbi:unnamed protein product [Phaeothamnion confervicola]
MMKLLAVSALLLVASANAALRGSDENAAVAGGEGQSVRRSLWWFDSDDCGDGIWHHNSWFHNEQCDSSCGYDACKTYGKICKDCACVPAPTPMPTPQPVATPKPTKKPTMKPVVGPPTKPTPKPTKKPTPAPVATPHPTPMPVASCGNGIIEAGEKCETINGHAEGCGWWFWGCACRSCQCHYF